MLPKHTRFRIKLYTIHTYYDAICMTDYSIPAKKGEKSNIEEKQIYISLWTIRRKNKTFNTHIPYFLFHVITHRRPIYKDGLAKPPLKLGCEWIIQP